MNIDTKELKSSHNIVDYINQYVPLKKTGGNHSGLCPFHSEKSPSFTVKESDQFYYCFGCGANGDIVDFIMQYQNIEFIDACKLLGADIALMPSDKIKANQSRVISSLPSYDARDCEKSKAFIGECTVTNINDMLIYDHDGDYYVSVDDLETGQPVNMYCVNDGSFILDGVSHLASTNIVKNQTNKYFTICNYDDGVMIANQYSANVMIVYTAYNMRLIHQQNKALKLMPIISNDDTYAHNLCDAGGWCEIVNSELIKRTVGDSFDS